MKIQSNVFFISVIILALITIPLLEFTFAQETVGLGDTVGAEVIRAEEVEELSVLRPLQQIKANIAPSDVQCKESLQLVIGHSGKPACVKPQTAETLVERGWTLKI